MRAIQFTSTGDSDVLELVDRARRDPQAGEVEVRLHRAGVNPTDWKFRRGLSPGARTDVGQVPGQDGAGVVERVGPGGDAELVGRRVWVYETAWQRPDGTAQEYVVVPASHAAPLADDASFDLGAALGIPFLTAHRCLTSGATGPERLGPGTLDGRLVLVAGGAGAVGNAAIQLARWAGATVLTTVSSPEKATLATAAGASHVINYREQDVVVAVREHGPVDVVVEVSPAANLDLDVEVLATNGTLAVYANNGGAEMTVPIQPVYVRNLRWQFVFVYTVPDAAKAQAVADVSAAVAAGAVRVGTDAGLPLHHYDLADTAAAHDAVEGGAVGKVLIDISG